MKRFLVCFSSLAFLLYAAPSHAQASRTWVSGTGLDTNPCSRTQPCLTFATALAATSAGGEINVLDPGGFGQVTINKSISIYNDGAGEAGIVVSAANAIIINAGTTDVINLRGLTLNGQGGGLGVHVLVAGKVHIHKCVIQQFGTGVNIATGASIKVKIEDTTIIHNTNGVSIQPGGGTAMVAIEHSRMDNNNGHGVLANGAFGGIVILGMSDSSASLNATHGFIARSGAAALVGVSGIRNSFVGNQQFGLQADATAGSGAFVTVGSTMFAANLGGAVQFTGANAFLESFGTNQIAGPTGTGFSGLVPLH